MFSRQLILVPLMFFAVCLTAKAQSVGDSNPQSSQSPYREMSKSRLETALSTIDLQIQKMEQEQSAIERKVQESKSVVEKLLNRRSELLDQQSEFGISSASYSEIVRMLQTQKIQLSIDLAGLDARQETLVTHQKGTATAQPDLINAIQQIKQVQELKLATVEKLRTNGSASEAEFLDAKKQLLEAQIRLAEASGNSGRGNSAAFDSELLKSSLMRAETAARLNKVNELLLEIVRARVPIDALEKVQNELQASESSMNKLNVRADEIANQLSNLELRKQQLEEELQRRVDND